MYSIVLMLAVSNNAAVPAWHHEDGISVAKRYGDSGRFEYRHRRGGCSGGCYGSHGCCGGRSYGGCCGGGYYGRGCTGGYYSNGNGRAMPSAESSSYYGSAVTQANDRATIVVHLPAEAKLLIDDAATQSTSEIRTFISPPLEQGKKFHYTLKAELNRDGKAVTQTKEITVEAGKSVDVNLDLSREASGQAAEPKAKTEKAAEPKANSGQGAQPKPDQPKAAEPKQDSPKAAEPKPNSGQAAEPKANTGQGAQPKPNSNQDAEPKP